MAPLPRQVEAAYQGREVIAWESMDPRTHAWVAYDAAASAWLEKQFMHGVRQGTVQITGIEFGIDFGYMEQINKHGYVRKIRRATILQPEIPPFGQRHLLERESVQWCSYDPRSGSWVDYPPATSKLLEEQFQHGALSCKLKIGGSTFIVDFTPGSMKQMNEQGHWRDVKRIVKLRKLPSQPSEAATAEPVVEPASVSRPVLYRDGVGWISYDPDPRVILIIRPGASLTLPCYQELSDAGYDLRIVEDINYDAYPQGWDKGCPDLHDNGGRNLATLADDRALPGIESLVAQNRGPSVVIAGSRGGQVTVPRLWDIGWRGPTFIINAGCIGIVPIPGPPVRLTLYTAGQDYFGTHDPDYTRHMLKNRTESEPVLLYHHPSETHRPSRLGSGLLQRLVEITRDGFTKAQFERGPGGRDWPSGAVIQLI